MFFRKKRLIEEQARTIEELNEKLQNQQKLMDDFKVELDAFKQREQAISRAMTDAAETATRIVTDAQKESDDIHDSAQKDFMESQKKGESVVQSAYENARDIIKDAEMTRDQKIKETDEAVCAYVKLLNQFNESMKEQARQAEENMKKLSDYYTRLNNALPELFAEVPQLSDSVSRLSEEQLPDPDDDPAKLMRNIYAIENRYLLHEDMPDRTSSPEEEAQEQAEEAPAAEETAASEQEAAAQIEAEEETVVKVSDIVSEDVGTIDTEEIIAQTADMGKEE